MTGSSPPASKLTDKGGVRRRAWAWTQRIVIFVAYAYPLALIATWMLLRFVGDYWWLSTAGLYLPGAGYFIPLPAVLLALAIFRLKRLLWTQLVAIAIVLFPLMGLKLPSIFTTAAGHRIRVLSFNVSSGGSGVDAIVADVISRSPDLVMIQEANFSTDALVEALKPKYRYTHASKYTLIASRFPLEEITPQQRIPHYGVLRSPRFQRYLIATPLGRIAVYNIHPLSPRGSLGMHRFRGVLSKLRKGELLNADAQDTLEDNAGLRRLQVEAVGRLASAEVHPVIIAGDTNLPGLSPLFANNLGSFRDGFDDAGAGFGYTFPAEHPWLRLDRILASFDLRFVSFEQTCHGLSDHLCVVAEIAKE